MEDIKMFHFKETAWDRESNTIIHVADWVVMPTMLHNDKIIIEKITPTRTKDDIIHKVFKVEECDDYVVKVLKTKIKAIGGANGLVDWMIKDKDVFECMIRRILNYAWDKMKFYYL